MDSKKKENSQLIYEANDEHVDMVKKIRETCHNLCSTHGHHPVRVQTVNGETYEGRIVHVDFYCLYLEVTPNARQFPFSPYGGYGYGGYGGYGGGYGGGYNPYYSTVMPLVLFDLLTISLLY